MASDAKKILLVEDEKAIRDAVAAYLEREGYWVVGVGDGQSAIEEFEKHQFDLVVLDLMLPKIPGERVCRTIRDTSDVPIIMLTAKGEIEDRIIGLELGADDYISKPFSLREVLARVKAVLRRTSQDEEAQDEEGVIRYQGLVLDDNRKEVWVDGEHVALTRIEYSLLLMMLENRGKILSRQQLINHVWPHDVIVLDRTVDVNITRLRRKVKAYAEHIVTRQGFGYGFEVKTN